MRAQPHRSHAPPPRGHACSPPARRERTRPKCAGSRPKLLARYPLSTCGSPCQRNHSAASGGWAMARSPAPEAAVHTAEGAPLDLHKGNSDGCRRWPPYLWLRSSAGELVRGRCRGPNQCAYCGKLAAVENAELLALDGVHGTAPKWWVVLTTAATEHRQAAYRSWWEVAKRRASCPTARLLEFTTGYGPRSGGERRPHWNVLLKGDEQHARRLLDSWRSVSGSTQGHVDSIDEVGGLLRYLALHFQKESQRPPDGWKGQRLTVSSGYLWTSTSKAREAARRSLVLKRELWKAEQRGVVGEVALDQAQSAVERAEALTWQLVRLAGSVVVA
jgi:hypothetical protein